MIIATEGCNLFCLQLEASCLQLSSFAYSCVWELFCLQLELFYSQFELPLLTVRGFFLTFFSRRFREGIAFPNFVERSIPELPLSKLYTVHFALQNTALFEGEKRAKICREKGRKRGGQERGQKGKKDAQKQVSFGLQLSFFASGGKVCLRSTSTDCKQRSSTGSKKASPITSHVGTSGGQSTYR